MGRGTSQPAPYGQMGSRPPDFGQFSGAFNQFRQDHSFPTNPGFPGWPQRPPVPIVPTPTNHPASTGGDGGGLGGGFGHDAGGNPGGFPGGFPGGGQIGGIFPGGGTTGGVFPGGGGSDATPTARMFPHGSSGQTMGRVGAGYGPISGRPSTLDRSFSPSGGRSNNQ